MHYSKRYMTGSSPASSTAVKDRHSLWHKRVWVSDGSGLRYSHRAAAHNRRLSNSCLKGCVMSCSMSFSLLVTRLLYSVSRLLCPAHHTTCLPDYLVQHFFVSFLVCLFVSEQLRIHSGSSPPNLTSDFRTPQLKPRRGHGRSAPTNTLQARIQWGEALGAQTLPQLAPEIFFQTFVIWRMKETWGPQTRFYGRFYGSQSGIKLWYGLSINPVPIYTSVVWYGAWLALAWKA